MDLPAWYYLTTVRTVCLSHVTELRRFSDATLKALSKSKVIYSSSAYIYQQFLNVSLAEDSPSKRPPFATC